jgi:hypothetical protein
VQRAWQTMCGEGSKQCSDSIQHLEVAHDLNYDSFTNFTPTLSSTTRDTIEPGTVDTYLVPVAPAE